MALVLANFKEAGGVGNSQDGGQLYTVFSTTDTLTTMMASGYLDGLTATLNVRDIMILTGTDGAQMVQISSNSSGVVQVSNLAVKSPAQALSGPGAVDVVTPTTDFTSTGVADALTMIDGVVGQRKTFIHVVDGGSAVLTPTTGLGYTTITFTTAGEAVELEFRTLGWAVIGIGGVSATLPVVA